VASLALLAALLTQPDAGPMSLANQLRLAQARSEALVGGN